MIRKLIQRWFAVRNPPTAPASVPRERCEHRDVCHLCPRSMCSGQLNSPDDPDMTKPRSSSYGRCIVIQGSAGPLRLRVSAEGANEHAARRDAERQADIPVHLRKGPGYDIEDLDIPDFLRADKS